MGSSSSTARRRTGLALLLAVILVASSVGPALAAPRVFVASASVETTAAVPGDPVDVRFQLRNTGDSGAGSVQITANGSVVFESRYLVDSGEIRNVTEQISFSEPGRYQIRVNDRRAGTVRISQTLVETTAIRSDGRTMELRGGRIPYNTRLTTTFPATNESVAVESLTYRTLQTEFTRTVELYTDPANASMTVPTGERTTLFGAVAIQSRSGIEDQRIRIGVNQSTVTNSSLTSDEVHIYRVTDGNYTRLNTTFTGNETGRYVFEAAVEDTRSLLVGSIGASFAVSDHSLSTAQTDTGTRIVVTANVTNTGGVEGNYTATLRIDGEAVDNQTVRLGPGETQPVSVSHRITRSGSYRVALDDESIVTVEVERNETPTETPDTEPTATDDGGEDEPTTPTETPGGETTAIDDETEPETDAQDGSEDTPTASSMGTSTESDSDDGPGLGITADDVGLTEIAIGGGVAIIGVILVLLQRW